MDNSKNTINSISRYFIGKQNKEHHKRKDRLYAYIHTCLHVCICKVDAEPPTMPTWWKANIGQNIGFEKNT